LWFKGVAMMYWNDRYITKDHKDTFRRSADFCGIIDNKIKIWPNQKWIAFKGHLNCNILGMVKKARMEDETFRCYHNPIETVDHWSPLFLGMYRLTFHRLAIGNGWRRAKW